MPRCKKAVMDPLDHKNIDKDVPYFATVVRYVNRVIMVDSLGA